MRWTERPILLICSFIKVDSHCTHWDESVYLIILHRSHNTKHIRCLRELSWMIARWPAVALLTFTRWIVRHITVQEIEFFEWITGSAICEDFCSIVNQWLDITSSSFPLKLVDINVDVASARQWHESARHVLSSSSSSSSVLQHSSDVKFKEPWSYIVFGIVCSLNNNARTTIDTTIICLVWCDDVNLT